jgi:Flp pilus assembly protein TadG
MRDLFRWIGRFGRDRGGNMAVIFALTCVPLLTAVGCALDYSRAVQIKSKLQSAIDAASVGSVARRSPAYLYAGAMSADGPIAVGVQDAKNIFNANMQNVTGYTLNDVTPVVARSNGAVTSKVTFSAEVPTMFLGVIGQRVMTMTGSSTSTANMPLYADFYLLLDNSPSMGVGATPADVQTMVNHTADKCAFACHDVNDPNNYYKLAKSLGVTTRIDVLRDATQKLMDTAAATQTYTSQFRMAIYDFGASADTIGLRSLFALSANLSTAKTAAGKIDLMTVAGQNDNNDQDTGYTALFPAIDKLIAAPGSGTPNAPMKYLLFVSDGVADEKNPACLKTMSNSAVGNISPRCQSPIDPALCKALTDRGVKIAVLYTTYLQLPTNSWYMSWIDPFNKGPWGPSPNSEIAQNMEKCASPGLYFEVSPTQGISDAMNKLFQKAVADARISR